MTVSPSPEQLSEPKCDHCGKPERKHVQIFGAGKVCPASVFTFSTAKSDALESAQSEIARLTTALQGVREPSPVSTMDYATLDTPIGNTTKGGPKQSLTLRQWLEADNRTPQFRARLMALCIIERQQTALAALKGNQP